MAAPPSKKPTPDLPVAIRPDEAPETIPRRTDEQSDTASAQDGKGEKAAGEPAPDVVLLHQRTEDGDGVRALRLRPGRLELTELRPAKEGQPLQAAELVRLRPRTESPLLFDVETLYRDPSRDPAPRQSTARTAGPPQVATTRYRRNWETIFGRDHRKKGGPGSGSAPN